MRDPHGELIRELVDVLEGPPAVWTVSASGPSADRCKMSAKLADLADFANFCKFLAGSLSAVSKRNFVRKYAFDCIFRALQDLHTSAPLRTQHVSKCFAFFYKKN